MTDETKNAIYKAVTYAIDQLGDDYKKLSCLAWCIDPPPNPRRIKRG